ncbi:hypothetical protein DB346_24140 [Verrucomicrobia bacterium LW23]|nr:hypothetical protein DB346_24140 [Verrucomicrobia bacterium LW23]
MTPDLAEPGDASAPPLSAVPASASPSGPPAAPPALTPLVLLVGFLGAGKTSFLRALIPLLGERGLSVSVIIHDYQNAGIDASLIAGLTQLVNAVSGSCVCCGAREELLDTLYTTEVKAPGVMLIETNGTTEPDDIIEILALDPRARPYSLPVQLSVVDAKRWQKRFWSNALEREQLRTATHIHTGWLDKTTDARAAEVRAHIATLNPGASPVTPESFADFLAAVALGRQAIAASAPAATARGTRPAGVPHAFACVELRLPAQLDRTALEAWLRGLPRDIVRAKGAVRLSDRPGWIVFQKVEGSADVMFIPLPQAPRTGPSMILIGPALDGEALAASARAALGTDRIVVAPRVHG